MILLGDMIPVSQDPLNREEVYVSPQGLSALSGTAAQLQEASAK